jgi:hypothetical protein
MSALSITLLQELLAEQRRTNELLKQLVAETLDD